MQPNSVVSWGDGVTPTGPTTAGQHTVSTPKQVGDGQHRRPQGLPRPGRPAHRMACSSHSTSPNCSKHSGPQPISACWCPGPRASARPLWCVPCAPTDGSSNSTAPRWARCAPKTGSRASHRRWPPCATEAACCSSPTSTRCCRRPPDPVATLILAELRKRGGHQGRGVHRHLRRARQRRPRLRAPDLCDRELGLSLPDGSRPQAAARGAAARRAVRGAQPR
mgnify:CR=1 FL=1